MKLRVRVVALLLGLTTLAVAGPSVYPTGTTLNNPAKALNTLVVITGGDGSARLIDMNGNSVHEWKNAGDLTTYLEPALIGGKQGHVLVTLSTVEGQGTDLVPGAVTTRIEALHPIMTAWQTVSYRMTWLVSSLSAITLRTLAQCNRLYCEA